MSRDKGHRDLLKAFIKATRGVSVPHALAAIAGAIRDGLRMRFAYVARDDKANLMPATIEAVKAHLSMGEITGALRDVFGTYTETPVY